MIGTDDTDIRSVHCVVCMWFGMAVPAIWCAVTWYGSEHPLCDEHGRSQCLRYKDRWIMTDRERARRASLPTSYERWKTE